MKKVFSFTITFVIFIIAILVGRSLWLHYMDSPWTRDGRVRADIINVAADVSGLVVSVPVKDNQLVKKGQVLLQIDPSHYQIALKAAKADVAAKKALLDMYQQQAKRREGMDNRAVSSESKVNADNKAAAARAAYQQAIAKLDAAQLNLKRTKVIAQTDGYVTNLNVYAGEYAHAGQPLLALVDQHSFWVYGYFEETKIPLLRKGDPVSIELMNGQNLKGHVDSIARGIYDRDNPASRDLVADVNPTFNWVRLAQRVPVRIQLDKIPDDITLSAGMTCTVIVHPTKKALLERRQNKDHHWWQQKSLSRNAD